MTQRSEHTALELLALLEATLREAPAFRYQESLSDIELRWLGRAEAIIEACNSISDLIEFRLARKQIGSYSHSRDALLSPLHNCYSRIELRAPIAARGAFIPAGDTWNGYAALVKLVQRECNSILIVDPYLNSDFFTDFAPHSLARKGLQCLTVKHKEYHPALKSAADKWVMDEIGKAKAVEVRYVPNGALHDRLIIIDGNEVWLISQSIKDIAKRSPASVSRTESEIGKLKAEHYTNLWETGENISTLELR